MEKNSDAVTAAAVTAPLDDIEPVVILCDDKDVIEPPEIDNDGDMIEEAVTDKAVIGPEDDTASVDTLAARNVDAVTSELVILPNDAIADDKLDAVTDAAVSAPLDDNPSVYTLPPRTTVAVSDAAVIAEVLMEEDVNVPAADNACSTATPETDNEDDVILTTVSDSVLITPEALIEEAVRDAAVNHPP